MVILSIVGLLLQGSLTAGAGEMVSGLMYTGSLTVWAKDAEI